ncbi:MAG: ABC transporter ATP-binding protein [Lachnospiraceae bacterium]|nr:ABC transporter ATP-binding protein [Lachnospiraceae bacterium]
MSEQAAKQVSQQSSAILEARDITIRFGGLTAVEDFNMEIHEKELIGLIGPNGAGKTTVFNILTGVYEATSGVYSFNGELMKKVPTCTLIKKGMARTFQNIRLFKKLTVLQNVLVAQNFKMRYGFFSGMLRLPAFWREEKAVKKQAMELLAIFGLDQYADFTADSLPYGQQRKLEMARAMATGPKLLLLDEPAAGMNPKETEELMETIRLIRDRFGIAILLIEHDMKLVLGVCERVVVLDHGKTIAAGDPLAVVNDPVVIKAYLGSDEEEEEET